MTGIGLRLPHIAEVAATRPSIGWLEIHPENFLANPHARELLLDLASDYPISVHTVGVSVGSASGVDRVHLGRVKRLVDDVSPFLVSGHLAWSTHQGEYLNDLLPLPYDEETLRVVSDHVREVQDVLGRPLLIENPSSYLGFVGSTMTEVEFLWRLVEATNCRLLCDVSNVHVSAHNLSYDPYAYLDGLPASAVAELHLGGFTPEPDEAAPEFEIFIDTHDTVVADECWTLYAYAVRRFGVLPTLIEWDSEIPPLDKLLAEAGKAEAIVQQEAADALAR